ncbi:MAG: hypothetical protein WC792_01440 [Candidatus Micrarchaeia archaeon]|jgi:hypothetical protein
MKKFFAILALFSILTLAPFALADAAPALPAQCTINGTAYNEYDFNPANDKCQLCVPGVSTTQWSATNHPCLCICGMRKSAVPPSCVDEIYYHGGNAWPANNSQDAPTGGCGRNWCAGGEGGKGKMCCVTNAYGNDYCTAPSDKRISIVDDPSGICNYTNDVPPLAPACPLPLPGELAPAIPQTNPCENKEDRENCGTAKACCKGVCVTEGAECKAAFTGFGNYSLHIGDHVELGEYDLFLVDGTRSGIAWLNLSKSGSIISSKIILEKGAAEKQISAGPGTIAKAALLRVYDDAAGKFTAEILLSAPQAKPSPLPTKTPAPTPKPKDDELPALSRNYFNNPPEGCELFSACGGAPPAGCVEKKAPTTAFTCREAAKGKIWRCRTRYETPGSFLLCPQCPQGFTHGGCAAGEGFGMQKALCHKDYASDCATEAGCGSDETLGEISSCDFNASGLKYCCATPEGIAPQEPTPVPVLLPPIPTPAQNPAVNASENATGPQKNILEKAARAILGPPPVVNITRLIHFPIGLQIQVFEANPFPVVEGADNGAFVEVRAAYKLSDKMNCTGPSDCECSLLSRTADTLVNYQCVFHPPVDGVYNLIAWDVNGNDNWEYVHSVKLTPGAPAVLQTALEKEKLDLILLFLSAILFIALAAAAYYAYHKISARFLRLQRLRAKKDHLEQEQKMLKYRFMRREISDASYQKLQDAIEKEMNEVKVDIADEVERQAKRRKWF